MQKSLQFLLLQWRTPVNTYLQPCGQKSVQEIYKVTADFDLCQDTHWVSMVASFWNVQLIGVIALSWQLTQFWEDVQSIYTTGCPGAWNNSDILITLKTAIKSNIFQFSFLRTQFAPNLHLFHCREINLFFLFLQLKLIKDISRASKRL